MLKACSSEKFYELVFVSCSSEKFYELVFVSCSSEIINNIVILLALGAKARLSEKKMFSVFFY